MPAGAADAARGHNGDSSRGVAVPANEVHPLASRIDAAVAAIVPRLVAWRRDIHEHPELGNREVRSAAIVAAHLRAL